MMPQRLEGRAVPAAPFSPRTLSTLAASTSSRQVGAFLMKIAFYCFLYSLLALCLVTIGFRSLHIDTCQIVYIAPYVTLCCAQNGVKKHSASHKLCMQEYCSHEATYCDRSKQRVSSQQDSNNEAAITHRKHCVLHCFTSKSVS